MSTLKVGEAAIGQNFFLDSYYNGAECIIISHLQSRLLQQNHTGHIFRADAYLVLWQNGKKTAAFPMHLRKKHPPTIEADTVVSWEACQWKPSKVTV